MKRTSTWKSTEREIARRLGGERVPITGRNKRGDAPDVEHEWLSIEVKHRKKLPNWIADAMSQAQASQRGEQLPIVVLHENRQRFDDAYVVIRLQDFEDWFLGNLGD